MQDTSDRQARLLKAVFNRSTSASVVQRVGDPNQAIFKNNADANISDPFPDTGEGRAVTIANSRRFRRGVSVLANPFAVEAIEVDGLQGIGPQFAREQAKTCIPTIFVFPDDDTSAVLNCYGQYVLDVFDAETLSAGAVTAVGAVHKTELDIGPGHGHYPKTVSHYWDGYEPETTKKISHPDTLAEYVLSAQLMVCEGGNLAPALEHVAIGMIRLAGLIGEPRSLRFKHRRHRGIVDAFARKIDVKRAYVDFVRTYLMDMTPLTAYEWTSTVAQLLENAVLLCDGEISVAAAGSFIEWPIATPQTVPPATAKAVEANTYVVQDAGGRVAIRLGSIHSAKGQTHLATLLLTTFFNGHFSDKTMPWLAGLKTNAAGEGVQNLARLRQSYVAMTRPTHLICVAVRNSSLGIGEARDDMIVQLKGQGWRVVDLAKSEVIERDE